jgi:hypothetical protein
MSEELLKQIIMELQTLNGRVFGLEASNTRIQNDLIDSRSQMNSRFDIVETRLSKIENDTVAIRASVERIERNEPEDVLAMLKRMEAKLDEKKHQ